MLVYDYSDSIPSAKHEVEYKFGDPRKYETQEVKQKVEVMVGGKRCSGTYQSTQYNGYNYFPTYQYLDFDGNDFQIDDRGLLVSYFWGSSSEKTEELSQEECLQVAKDFFDDIVDINQYTITIDQEDHPKRYVVTFTKYVDGLATTDSATVDVQCNGQLYSYFSFMLGRIPSDLSVKGINTEDIEAQVYRKMDQIYEEAKKGYSRVEYGKPEMRLTVLKDGNIGMVCWLDVDCINTSGWIIGERIVVVVVSD